MAYKGLFKPRNPHKYKGNPTKITYRSRWETVVMSRLDNDPNVVWWQSELVIVPYRSPIDNKIHRYFPDFVCCIRQPNGTLKTMMLEVKPLSQSHPPEQGNKKRRQYIKEVMTWGVNEAKWKAATEYCADRGMDFVVLTEKNLGLKF